MLFAMTSKSSETSPTSSSSSIGLNQAVDGAAQKSANSAGSDTFRISPLIRITLLGLYLALTLPLPFLAEFANAPHST